MMDRINVWGYLKDYHANKKEILNAVDEVFESGILILGNKGKTFEENYSKYCGIKYGVGCDNGTNAISLALKAIGIKENDEVITVPNTAIPTVSAIVSVGAIPVFVDIDPKTYLMDVSKIERAITDKTKCIIPVHLYGQCVEMDPLIDIAQKYDLRIVEDCAQAQGAEYKGRKAGAMSDISSTSFYPTKILGAYGDGGMVITNNEQYYKELKMLRFYGAEKTYYANEHGYNSRLDEVQAAILLTKLPHIDEYIDRRRQIASLYSSLLKDTDLILPYEAKNCKHAFYLYVVRHKHRDLIIERLKEYNIYVNISYPWPIHIMDGYKYLGYKEGDFVNTEKSAKEIFSLPMYPTLTDEEVIYISDTLHRILKQIK
jgi:dTDP-3-amino-2,3,6-trideoxy-4-keto-D-glucose/dTDP-3-amino-3,4,6-trideoxy-alpha-D-glucose/dTDP-2,6-dideoxy-D-kanosamine transaminase